MTIRVRSNHGDYTVESDNGNASDHLNAQENHGLESAMERHGIREIEATSYSNLVEKANEEIGKIWGKSDWYVSR